MGSLRFPNPREFEGIAGFIPDCSCAYVINESNLLMYDPKNNESPERFVEFYFLNLSDFFSQSNRRTKISEEIYLLNQILLSKNGMERLEGDSVLTEALEVYRKNCYHIPKKYINEMTLDSLADFQISEELWSVDYSHPTFDQPYTEARILERETETNLFRYRHGIYSMLNSCLEKIILRRDIDVNILKDIEMLEQKGTAISNLLFKINAPLVAAMIKKEKPPYCINAFSEGYEALFNAIRGFNPDLGNKFSTYACKAIINSFKEAYKKQHDYDSLPIDYDPNPMEISQISLLREQKYQQNLELLIEFLNQDNGLEAIEKEVLHYRFGVGNLTNEKFTKPLTLSQAAEKVGKCRERVRQIQENALKKLRHLLN